MVTLMVDKDVVLNRIKHLEDNINYLKKIENFNQKTFSSDPDIYYRFERALHLAVEAVLDLGNHLIADQNLETPDSNRDIFRILFENHIINDELKESLIKMAGFRNILVHDYLDLDREIEFKIIKDNIKDIREFMKIILNYI